MKILIRDVASAPPGSDPKPFEIKSLSAITKIPEFAVRAAIKPGTIVELTIETSIINSTKYFVIQ